MLSLPCPLIICAFISICRLSLEKKLYPTGQSILPAASMCLFLLYEISWICSLHQLTVILPHRCASHVSSAYAMAFHPELSDLSEIFTFGSIKVRLLKETIFILLVDFKTVKLMPLTTAHRLQTSISMFHSDCC